MIKDRSKYKIVDHGIQRKTLPTGEECAVLVINVSRLVNGETLESIVEIKAEDLYGQEKELKRVFVDRHIDMNIEAIELEIRRRGAVA